jgi:hypothetical protein
MAPDPRGVSARDMAPRGHDRVGRVVQEMRRNTPLQLPVAVAALWSACATTRVLDGD